MAEKPKKRADAMHKFQAEREAWKAGGRQGPEPVRPAPDQSDKRRAGRGMFRRAAK